MTQLASQPYAKPFRNEEICRRSLIAVHGSWLLNGALPKPRQKPQSLPFRLNYCNFSHWPNENKRTIMATWLEQLWPESAGRCRPVAPTVTLATPAADPIQSRCRREDQDPGNYLLIYNPASQPDSQRNGEKPFT